MLIGSNEIQLLIMLGTAIFKPCQKVELHKSNTRYEVFFRQTGNAIFAIEGKEFEVGPGTVFLQIQVNYIPKKTHKRQM